MIRWIQAQLGWVVVVALLSMGSALVWQGHKVSKLEAEKAKIEKQRNDLQIKVFDQQELLNEYRQANKDLEADLEEVGRMYEVELERNTVLARDLQAERRALQRQRQYTAQALDNLRRAKESAYAHDEACREWGARPVCGPVTGGVLDAWAIAQRSGSHSVDQGPGQGLD